MEAEDTIKLFECCIPVEGSTRSIIYDLNRRTYEFIPNMMLELLTKFDGRKICEIIEHYGEENRANIEEYISYLLSKEYIFFCQQEEFKFFPKIKLDYESPFDLQCAEIEIRSVFNFDYTDLFSQLEAAGCRHLNLIWLAEFEYDALDYFLNIFTTSAMKSIELILKYSSDATEDRLNELVRKHNRLALILLHSAPEDKILKQHYYGMQMIQICQKSILEGAVFRITDTSYFNVNIRLFTEAHHRNPYFNQKIAIDSDGNFRNSNSATKIYGNLRTHRVEEVVNKEEFKKLWYITKDKIEGCSCCEFRYMCPDNRVPIEVSKDSFRHSTACSYDPFTNNWKDIHENQTRVPSTLHLPYESSSGTNEYH